MNWFIIQTIEKNQKSLRRRIMSRRHQAGVAGLILDVQAAHGYVMVRFAADCQAQASAPGLSFLYDLVGYCRMMSCSDSEVSAFLSPVHG